MSGAAAKASIQEVPNKFAAPARLTVGPGVALVRGYQNFAMTADGVTPAVEDGNLCTKKMLLEPIWDRKLLHGRHILDLGANAGFFALWSLEYGAASATAVDMDAAYLEMVQRVKAHVGIERLHVAQAQVDQWKEPADVVLALALVHWVYSCTADFGSLDAVIGWLAGLTRYALIVEWVSPEDFAIAGHGHTLFNAGAQSGPYSYRAFGEALRRNFARVIDLGFLTATRRLFLAYKKPVDLDLSGPLPLLHDANTLLGSRWLTSLGQEHFWSRVYDLGDSILKQASFDLETREARFLRMVVGDAFPKVLETTQEPGYSTVRLEKIVGESLQDAAAGLRADRRKMAVFVNGCVEILQRLREKGIRHRDIHGDNIIVRDGRPVLLDFAWAVTETDPYITPAPLGELEHACDVVGMGKALAPVVAGLDPALDQLILAMTHPDERLRVTNVDALRQMAAAAFAGG